MELLDGPLSKPWGRELGLEAKRTQLGLKAGVEFRAKRGAAYFNKGSASKVLSGALLSSQGNGDAQQFGVSRSYVKGN